jgi:hypothetical protein
MDCHIFLPYTPVSSKWSVPVSFSDFLIADAHSYSAHFYQTPSSDVSLRTRPSFTLSAPVGDTLNAKCMKIKCVHSKLLQFFVAPLSHTVKMVVMLLMVNALRLEVYQCNYLKSLQRKFPTCFQLFGDTAGSVVFLLMSLFFISRFLNSKQGQQITLQLCPIKWYVPHHVTNVTPNLV